MNANLNSKMTAQHAANPPALGTKHRPLKKIALIALLTAAAVGLAAPTIRAQPGGYGPGMMGGYGGYGGNGGYGGYGMGPGMMYGYGGPGAYGMGPEMMGGYGGYGMGPGMMYGYGPYGLAGIDLSQEQRDKIARIQEAFSQKQWGLMGQMRDARFKLRDLVASGKADDAAVGKAYKQIEDLRQQMWSSMAESRKQFDAVLTKEQRDQLQRGWGRGSD